MTAPRTLPPPLDFHNRPPKELAGYSALSVPPGGAIPAPTRPSIGESLTLLTMPTGRGLGLVRQPAAISDYLELDKPKYDAMPFNAARIIVNVFAVGATTARARLFYSTTGQPGSWLDAGVDLSGNTKPLVCKLNATGILEGNGPLAPNARDDVYFAVMFDNGDGVETPVIGAVFLQFLNKEYRACVWTPVVTQADMLAPGDTILVDSRWVKTGNVGGFQSFCFAPGCLGWYNAFRFGTGMPLNAAFTRQWSLSQLGVQLGVPLKISGEASWTYAHLACGWEANPAVRMTLSVNGVAYSSVPSGFPPMDPNWLPVEIIVPATGAGVGVGFGLYGDNGECSLSVNGAFRNFQIEALTDGGGGGDCI